MWNLIRPLLFKMDAEKAHRWTIDAMVDHPNLISNFLNVTSHRPIPELSVDVAGLKFASPIGLAAGLDKDGEGIPIWESVGFGFMEIGTVTAHPQKGNPQPRLFRLIEEEGIINRMGFNNAGSEALMERIIALRELNMWPSIPVGANVGKSKITPLEQAGEDYRTSIQRLQGLVDYFTVNVSSPNTPGLRDLQSADNLKKLLDVALPAAKGTPVFVKFAPDMNPTDLAEAIDMVIECGASGIIGTNTTNTRPKTTDRYGETGGLSGEPLWTLAREQIQLILDATDNRVPVIGVGGVNSPERAQTLLNMGCKAVQLYSALIYKGPWLISDINRSLRQR